MRLALIPPISLLEYTDETYCQMMLPHLLGNPQYSYVYRMHCADPKQFVILDNGENEGVQVTDRMLIRSAIGYGVSEIVIPDSIGHERDTVDKACAFHGVWVTEAGPTSSMKLMFVAQGATYKEFLQSAFWADSRDWIHTIGLPRHMLQTCDDIEARVKLASALRKPVHLLGGSPMQCAEIRDYTWPSNVRSHDTSSPFNFAFASKRLGWGNEATRPEGYFDLDMKEFDEGLLNKNVHSLMKWTGNSK